MKFHVVFVALLVQLLRVDARDECGVVTVSEWGGLETPPLGSLEQPVDMVIIQHTVSQECYTDERCESIVRGIQWYHMSLGWKDIGYSFLVGGNGKVYEGRGWSQVGAHSFGFNSRSIGIAFIGDFRENEPTPEALRAAQNLLRCGVIRRRIPRNYYLVGHKQVRPTESPGTRLMEIIEQWPNWTPDASVIPTRY